MPSFILIRQTVWPQYINVTDRQTDIQAGWFLWPDCAPSSECPELQSLHAAAPTVQSEYPAKRRAAAAVPLPESP